MYIRQQIQGRMDSTFRMFRRDGSPIADTEVKREYQIIRQYLLDHVKCQETIAIKIIKDYRYLLTILACQEIGITYIPMKYDYPNDRVEQIREDSSFVLLMNEAKMEEALAYRGQKITELPEVHPDYALYTIFTSGSTGRPKGVTIQRKALENFFRFLETFNKINSEDHLLQVTEFTFDISLVDVGLFLSKNVALYFSAFEGNIFRLGYEIETYKITTLNTVPNNLNMFLSELVAERMDYSHLRKMFIGGARFSHGLYQKCLHYFKEPVDIVNFYGPTEATVYCHAKLLTFDPAQDCQDANVSIGIPLPGVDAVIVGDGKALAPNERGELLLGGIQLLKEYCNNPEKTREALTTFEGKTYYRSGDLAFKDHRGEYYIVGRNDDTIKYRGFRVNLLDIDSYIMRMPYIQDSATIAVEDENADNLTVGFLIMKEPKTVKEIKKDLASVLLDYQIPEKIVFVDSYPTNVSGKVDRKALKANYLASLKKA